eukprot:276329_1
MSTSSKHLSKHREEQGSSSSEEVIREVNEEQKIECDSTKGTMTETEWNKTYAIIEPFLAQGAEAAIYDTVYRSNSNSNSNNELNSIKLVTKTYYINSAKKQDILTEYNVFKELNLLNYKSIIISDKCIATTMEKLSFTL